MNKDIIRAGDIVEVITPEIIISIGYDFNHKNAVQKIKEDNIEDVRNLMRTMKVTHRNWDRVEEKLISALAYDLVRKGIKTGNERRIHTEVQENFRGLHLMVVSKKRAVTGTYFPPTGGGPDHNGEYDYEPGGLTNPKTHVVLELGTINTYSEKDILIEQCNVKKIQ